jgi:hypothetical protein
MENRVQASAFENFPHRERGVVQFHTDALLVQGNQNAKHPTPHYGDIHQIEHQDFTTVLLEQTPQGFLISFRILSRQVTPVETNDRQLPGFVCVEKLVADGWCHDLACVCESAKASRLDDRDGIVTAPAVDVKQTPGESRHEPHRFARSHW